MSQATPGRDDAHVPNGRDPTVNVRLLLEAAVSRLDDLRIAEAVRVDSLREAEFRRVNEQLTLRSIYEDKLQLAEAKRIDAIRAVDVNAVAVANERSAASALVLANQVAASAEALRGLVATTTAAQSGQLAQVTDAIIARLAALERSSYEGTGKARVADPAIERLALQVEKLTGSSSGGMRDMYGWIMLAAGVVIAAAAFFFQ